MRQTELSELLDAAEGSTSVGIDHPADGEA